MPSWPSPGFWALHSYDEAMGCYHRDDSGLGLDVIETRLHGTDLIPSFEPLRESFSAMAQTLLELGVDNVRCLRHNLRTPRRRAELAERGSLDPAMLTLLRRYVEGWFPKPPKLTVFPDHRPTAEALAPLGILTAADLIASASTREEQESIAQRAGVATESLRALVHLCDLTRIQWVAPTFARIIHAAGFTSPQELAGATDVADLHERLRHVEATLQPGRPGIGRRDVVRLLELAAWLPLLTPADDDADLMPASAADRVSPSD